MNKKMSEEEILKQLKFLGSGWQLNSLSHIEKNFNFPDFVSALKFVNEVGKIAEEMQHHPDIFLAWGKVKIETWTHSIDALSEKDFTLINKIIKIKELGYEDEPKCNC